ncbi:alpha/beta hydrolase [Mycobacterium intracellulare]|uniref:putative alpha/beta hydrolase n=1 Tax=Mycobacterium intracellulare TaxID=1767 RepID=UPI0035588483
MQLKHLTIGELVAGAGGDPWEVNRTLQAGSPAQIERLAGAFHGAGRHTAEADHAFAQAQQRFNAAWNHQDGGPNPINNSVEVQRTVKSLGAQSEQLPKIGADLENIAAALADAQKAGAQEIAALEGQLEQLDHMIDLAEQDLRDHPDAASQQELHAIIKALRTAAVNDTKDALSQLNSTRNGYSGTLQNSLGNLRADGYDPKPLEPVDAQDKPEHIQIPPPNTKPEDAKRWWESLSQEERDQLVAQHPPELGNLKGIDTVDRDKVNQAVMNDDIARVETAASQHHASVDQVTQHPEQFGLTPAAITRYNNATQTKNGLTHDSDGGKNPVFLQTYDPEAFDGRGREAIAIGNPDTADNTTVLVPGTGSSVNKGYLSHDDGLHVYNEVRKADLTKSNSVLVWMGYHAPDSALDPQIGQTTLARDGGGLLAGDVNALGVTHQSGMPSHVTVIGHSYGSTTVADAAAGSGMHANDVVLVGCPGTDLAHNAGDFHLPEGGHVYVGAASTDPITHLGGIQGHLPGTGVTVGLGSDPAGEGWGSTRFKAEAPGLTFPLKDHSSYFTPGNESLFSMADIASGHGDALAHDNMTAQHRGTYWLPDEFDPEALRRPTGGHYH